MKTPSTDRYKYRKAPTKNRNTHTDIGIYALAAAIVKQAVDDYRYADAYLNGEKDIKSVSWANRYAHNAECTKAEIVKFFNSQWYGILCDIDPQRILDKLGARA